MEGWWLGISEVTTGGLESVRSLGYRRMCPLLDDAL